MQWHDETQGQVFTNQTALKNMLRVLGFYFVDMWLPLMSHGILRNLIWLKKKDSQMKNIYFMFIWLVRSTIKLLFAKDSKEDIVASGLPSFKSYHFIKMNSIYSKR